MWTIQDDGTVDGLVSSELQERWPERRLSGGEGSSAAVKGGRADQPPCRSHRLPCPARTCLLVLRSRGTEHYTQGRALVEPFFLEIARHGRHEMAKVIGLAPESSNGAVSITSETIHCHFW